MVELLRCQDRWGRWIILDADQWIGHVLVRHNQLTDQENAVRATVESPEIVTRDLSDPRREQYYRPSILLPPLDRTYLKVCVDFSMSIGFIVTAFPVKRVHPKELVRWP